MSEGISVNSQATPPKATTCLVRRRLKTGQHAAQAQTQASLQHEVSVASRPQRCFDRLGGGDPVISRRLGSVPSPIPDHCAALWSLDQLELDLGKWKSGWGARSRCSKGER